MSILVTGASGLVGARLVPRLAEAGLECRVLVRPGKDASSQAAVATGDILDPASLAQAVAGVSAIVHLAAVFRTPDEELIWTSNLEGTRNLVAAAQAHAPGARFILASTGHVYDMDTPHPGREDDPVAPTHAYPASKAAAEQVVRESGLTWSVLRFPFVYGDGDGHLSELPRHVTAGGWHPAQRMSTLHHRDLAAALRLALSGVMDGRTVNLADEAALSIYELVALAGERMEGDAKPLDNPWHLHADATLARSLGFRPMIRTVRQAAEEGLL